MSAEGEVTQPATAKAVNGANGSEAVPVVAKKKLAPQGGMLNLQSRDPFADADNFELGPGSGSGTPVPEEPGSGGKIHIRIQQRNGRKTLTTLQGLGKAYDPKKLLKAFKKEFACNGNVVSSEEAGLEDATEKTTSNAKKPNFGQVIQLQGDQRAKIREFLISTGIVSEKDAKERIQVHGH